jgi:two-component system, NarL family, nitrate/nitrite response regulator NarL
VSGAARSPPLTVVIVAQVRVFRESLATTLERRERLHVLGVARDWGEVARYFQSARPDVLIVDAGSSTLDAGVRLLRGLAPRTRFVAVAVPNSDIAILRCLEAGMSGYVTADASVPDLVETIERATSGELLCPPRIAAALGRRVSDLAAAQAPVREFARLTTREIEILHLLERGLSNQQIAARLFIEVTTVKNHVHHILAKLHVQRRGEAANWMRSVGVRREPRLRLLDEAFLGDRDPVAVGDGEEHRLARQHR